MSVLNDKLQEMTAEDVANIYKRIFGTPDGQLMLEDLKNRCFSKLSLPFGEEGQRAEGMRAVVLHIESMINYKPEVEDAVTPGRE